MTPFRIVMDGVKLFFVNVFLFVVFYESYIIIMLIQDGLHIRLPMMEFFLTGCATFISIIVWMNISYLWFNQADDFLTIFQRVALAELPFIALLGFTWFVSAYYYVTPGYASVLGTLGWFLLLHPFAMYAGYIHGKVGT